ncbi:MAG: cell division protein ZapA [Clostridia bacterium]|nr:cell division protein ZapA [Clostridia bacterium]MBQ4323326.1 cell division protein ZapA [Clostridia bacterium]
MEETIYTVNIGGFDLKMYSSETEAETTSIVKAVNRRIREFDQGPKGAPKINAILLTCMALCDENRQLKEKLENQRAKNAALKAQIAQLKNEMSEE